jgi:drug/metabolite transporter (DMT)-like permease
MEYLHHLDSLAIGLLIACCLFWGFQQILIKTTVTEVPPLWQASLRIIGATVLLGCGACCARCRCSSATARLRAGLLAGPAVRR